MNENINQSKPFFRNSMGSTFNINCTLLYNKEHQSVNLLIKTEKIKIDKNNQ